VKPEAMTLRVPVRQESLRLHNKARLARGLAPLPQKRRSRLEQPDAQACPSESAIAAGECEGPTAADPPDLADSLDLVLAQLAMDDECSEGSMTDDDGDHEEGDEPEDVPSKIQPAELGPLRFCDPMTPSAAADHIAAQHPYHDYA
jgi:hypothetical protein